MAELRGEGVGHIPFPPAFKRADGSPMAAPERTPLAEGKVYYVGQPVVAVVAESRDQAQDAAELAVVEYEELPSVVDARAAIAQGVPLLWEGAGGNIAAEASYGQPEEVEKAFANAAHVTGASSCTTSGSLRWRWSRAARIGVHEGARTTLYTQNQTPTAARELLGAVFGASRPSSALVNGDIGGGFGMKTGVTPEDALCATPRASSAAR